jgi:hypothetical protein
MRIFALVALAAAVLSGCSTHNIVAGSASTFGLGGQTRPDGTVQAAIGFVQGDFVTVPHIVDDEGNEVVARMKGICGQEETVSVYGSLTGNATAAVQGSPSVTLNVGRGLSTGAAATFLTLATLTSAGGDASDVYDCSNTLMDEKEYRDSTGVSDLPE